MYWLFSIPIFISLYFLLSALNIKEKQRTIVLSFVFFILTSGNYYNGVDWLNYIYTYHLFYINEPNILSLQFEPGYLLVNWLLSRFFEDFHSVYFLNSFLWSVFFYKYRNFFKEKNVSSEVLMVVSYVFMGNLLFSGAIRQSFALLILLPSMLSMTNVSFRKWTLKVALASMFHFSAILILPLYFVVKRRATLINVLLIIVGLIALGCVLVGLPLFSNYFDLIPVIGRKLSSAFDRGAEAKLGLTIIIDFVCLAFLLTYRKKLVRNGNDILYLCTLMYFGLHACFMLFPYGQRLNAYLQLLALSFLLVSFRRDIFTVLTFGVVLLSISISTTKALYNPFFSFQFYNPMFYYSSLGLDSNEIFIRGSNICAITDDIDDRFCNKFHLLMRN